MSPFSSSYTFIYRKNQSFYLHFEGSCGAVVDQSTWDQTVTGSTPHHDHIWWLPGCLNICPLLHLGVDGSNAEHTSHHCNWTWKSRFFQFRSSNTKAFTDLEAEGCFFFPFRNRRQLKEVSTDDQLNATKWLHRPPHWPAQEQNTSFCYFWIQAIIFSSCSNKTLPYFYFEPICKAATWVKM